MKAAHIAALVLFGWVAGSSPTLAGPAIASEWTDMNMPQEECFKRGEAAIARLGFKDLERTRFSRYGQLGDYTVVVRCVEEKKIVLFLGAGPSRERAQKYQIDLYRLFDKP